MEINVVRSEMSKNGSPKNVIISVQVEQADGVIRTNKYEGKAAMFFIADDKGVASAVVGSPTHTLGILDSLPELINEFSRQLGKLNKE